MYASFKAQCLVFGLFLTIFELVSKILITIACALKSLNKHACKLSSGVRGVNLGQNLYLYHCFMCANTEGSGETAHFYRLVRAFAARICNKYKNRVNWLILCEWDRVAKAQTRRRSIIKRAFTACADPESFDRVA